MQKHTLRCLPSRKTPARRSPIHRAREKHRASVCVSFLSFHHGTALCVCENREETQLGKVTGRECQQKVFSRFPNQELSAHPLSTLPTPSATRYRQKNVYALATSRTSNDRGCFVCSVWREEWLGMGAKHTRGGKNIKVVHNGSGCGLIWRLELSRAGGESCVVFAECTHIIVGRPRRENSVACHSARGVDDEENYICVAAESFCVLL